MPYTGLVHAVKQIAKEEGLRGFYKGLLPSLLLVSLEAVLAACLCGDKPEHAAVSRVPSRVGSRLMSGWCQHAQQALRETSQ